MKKIHFKNNQNNKVNKIRRDKKDKFKAKVS